jgi:hypothetical protein
VFGDEQLECLLQSDSEQNLSDLDFDTESELKDRALLDTVRNEGSDEDDSATQRLRLEEYGEL